MGKDIYTKSVFFSEVTNVSGRTKAARKRRPQAVSHGVPSLWTAKLKLYICSWTHPSIINASNRMFRSNAGIGSHIRHKYLWEPTYLRRLRRTAYDH